MSEKKNPSNARELLLRLALAYDGDWDAMHRAIREKDPDISEYPDPTPEDMRGWRPITIVDPDYPAGLTSNCPRPPFVIWVKGPVSTLSQENLLVCGQLSGGRDNPAVAAFIDDLGKSGFPAMILWREKSNDESSHARMVLEAYEAALMPVSVFLPASAADPEGIADRVLATGGVALTEKCPWTKRHMDPGAARVPAAICGAALVLGGKSHDATAVDASVAASIVKNGNVGALAREVGDPEGAVCRLFAKEGADLIDTVEDLSALMQWKGEHGQE